PLRLRSVNNKSLLVETILSPAHLEPIVVTGLIDSGASAKAFADRALVKALNITIAPTLKPKDLLLANNEIKDIIIEYFIAEVTIGLYKEPYLFFVTKLSKDIPLIFRLL